MKRINLILIGLMLLGLASNATAAYDLNLQIQNSIPNYCQEEENWCGEAVIQMILEGYPRGIEHQYCQRDIWEKTQAYKNDNQAREYWSTDPDGLKKTLMDLGRGTGSGVNWSILTNADAQSLMYFVNYCFFQ